MKIRKLEKPVTVEDFGTRAKSVKRTQYLIAAQLVTKHVNGGEKNHSLLGSNYIVLLHYFSIMW
jgi:hypothetical protein